MTFITDVKDNHGLLNTPPFVTSYSTRGFHLKGIKVFGSVAVLPSAFYHWRVSYFMQDLCFTFEWRNHNMMADALDSRSRGLGWVASWFMHLSVAGAEAERIRHTHRVGHFSLKFWSIFHPGAKISIQTPPPLGNYVNY